MDYSQEEIGYVRFCTEFLECKVGRKECPLHERCEEVCTESQENAMCLQIITKMESGQELSQEDKEVISFFYHTDGQWNSDECKPKNKDNRCYNWDSCNERESGGQKNVCETLILKLDLYSPEQWRMYEREIQKVILNDLAKSKIDWQLGEDLEEYASWPQTPVGEPDILLVGKETKTLYVVELKAVEASREHVGQLASYVGWYKENPGEIPSQTKAVKGILLAPKLSKGAEYAIRACTNLDKRCFDLHVEIKPVK